MPRSVIIGGALILLLLLGYEVYRTRVRDAVDAADCRSLYQRARSAADTSRVDVQVAPHAQSRGDLNLICGELRRLSRIR